jgi:hypothetical protein
VFCENHTNSYIRLATNVGGGGYCRVATPLQIEIKKQTDFCRHDDIKRFTRNHPLTSADDWFIAILRNKMNLGSLRRS